MSDKPELDRGTQLAEERTGMALFRTSIAMDRTLLAWVRTTLSMTSFGLSMIAFFRTLREKNETPETIRMHELAIHFGLALVILGLAATVIVIYAHLKTLRQLKRDQTPALNLWPISVQLAILVALLSLYALWVVLAH